MNNLRNHPYTMRNEWSRREEEAEEKKKTIVPKKQKYHRNNANEPNKKKTFAGLLISCSHLKVLGFFPFILTKLLSCGNGVDLKNSSFNRFIAKGCAALLSSLCTLTHLITVLLKYIAKQNSCTLTFHVVLEKKKKTQTHISQS